LRSPKPGVGSGAQEAAERAARAKLPLFDPDHPALAGLTDHQRRVVPPLLAKRNVFLTGCAGGGKTQTLIALVEAMQAAKTVVIVTSTTGNSAAPLKGCTLHAAMGGMLDDWDLKESVAHARQKCPDLLIAQVLVVEEVSMASAEIMQRVVDILVQLRGHCLPVFLLVGDFRQLPPVSGTLLLGSSTWDRLAPVSVHLMESHRQAGQPELLAILNEAAVGSLSDRSIAILRGRVGVEFPDGGDIRPTFLTPLLAKAKTVNDSNLKQLAQEGAEEATYVARITQEQLDPLTQKWCVVPGCTSDLPPGLRFRPKALEGAHVLLKDSRDAWHAAAELAGSSSGGTVLHLAVGAEVVFTRNVDHPRLVNGTKAVVVGFEDVEAPPKPKGEDGDGEEGEGPAPAPAPGPGPQPSRRPIVKLGSGDLVVVSPYTIMKRLVRSSVSPVVTLRQIPLKPAWALTVHASQGMSLDRLKLELSGSMFSTGQAYVALSRVRTLEGLSLTEFNPRAIKADPEVVAWYRAQEDAVRKEQADTSPFPTAATRVLMDGCGDAAYDGDDDLDYDEAPDMEEEEGLDAFENE